MILPDVNVLVHAFRSDSSDHDSCLRWLTRLINGESRYGMAPQVLSSVIRIVTHPRIFVQPSSLPEVIGFCDALVQPPHCVSIQPGAQHWQIFVRLCHMADARGNLVSDAWYAALAIESGCEWVTLDRDYARFQELNWRLPD